MHSSNLAQTMRWALIGGIAAIGFAGLNFAIGQGPLNAGGPVVEGWRAAATYDPGVWPRMEFDVSVQNAANMPRDLQMVVKLVRQEFRGNPASRAFSPNDFVNTELEAQQIESRIVAGQSRRFHVRFRTTYSEPPIKSPGQRQAAYVIQLSVNGKPLRGTTAHPRL